ncbi:MAG: HEAT repeat domain-containing protein [Chloroflexi bacterium]|nr:HEAT repeat domain-containing protein [Chloroflexota bacterium]
MEPSLPRKPDLTPGLGGTRRKNTGLLARLAGFGRYVSVLAGGSDLTPERTGALVEALVSGHSGAREAAAHALDGLQATYPPSAVMKGLLRPHTDALLSALSDPLPPVRSAALSALGMIAAGFDPAPLLHALTDKDQSVRQAACWALGNLGSPAAVPDLLEMLNDPTWSVRGAAVRALTLIGMPATTHLCRALKHSPSPAIRLGVTTALRYIADGRAVPCLVEALHHDTSPDVRNMAIHALARIPAPESIAALVGALNDHTQLYPGFEWAVCDTAAVALERIAPADVRARVAVWRSSRTYPFTD